MLLGGVDAHENENRYYRSRRRYPLSDFTSIARDIKAHGLHDLNSIRLFTIAITVSVGYIRRVHSDALSNGLVPYPRFAAELDYDLAIVCSQQHDLGRLHWIANLCSHTESSETRSLTALRATSGAGLVCHL